MYFHKPQEKPRRWGSFQDVQYAIRKNAEKIYQIDPDSMVLCMPLFWGLPPLDYSGKNNHGTNNGTIYKDGSLDFDGSDDYVDLNAPDSLRIASNLTLFSWVKRDTNSNNYEGIIVYAKTSATFGGYSLMSMANGKIRGCVDDNYVNDARTTNAISNDIWHSLALRSDGINYAVYVDGLKASADKAIVSYDSALMNVARIGFSIGEPEKFDGLISEVRISNVTHSADQIALFHDRPWALYQPVSRPVYFFQGAAGLSIPVAMQNMRGGFNPIGMRGGFINAG